MKRDIVDFISRCLTCQKIKIEHQRPGGLIQSLPIPEWKWEHIIMDFVVGLPKSKGNCDSIWVIVDRLTKFSHFLPVNTTFTTNKYEKIYINEILRLHGASVSIISDQDPKFTLRFWASLQQALGTTLKLSTVFYM